MCSDLAGCCHAGARGDLRHGGDLAGSPYIIQAYIKVLSASTLTIEPGVVVEFDGLHMLKATDDSSIVAIGTSENQILFTSHSATPAAGDWTSVYMFHSLSSVFTYCSFEYGKYTLYADRSDSPMTFCTLRYGDYCGIACEDSSPLIESCTIIDNYHGIRIHGPNGHPVINNCNIYNNSSHNLYVTQYIAPSVTVIDAQDNWWGVDTAPEIEETIDILSASVPYVEIDYDPWLHEAPVEKTSWGRVKALFAD